MDATVAPARLTGDINNDGVVDVSDFLVLAENFGKADATREDGDLDGDGSVQFSDFLVLVNNFGMSVGGR